MIKLTDLLKEITEGKQVGNLYHYSFLTNISNILDDGLKFQKDNIEDYLKEYSIAATRNHNFSGFDVWNFMKRSCRIVLDGDEISQRYKIAPVNADNIWNSRTDKLTYKYYSTSKTNNLYEERIYSNTPGYLSSDYILKIDINTETQDWEHNVNMHQEILDKADMKKIPINMIKDFNSK